MRIAEVGRTPPSAPDPQVRPVPSCAPDFVSGARLRVRGPAPPTASSTERLRGEHVEYTDLEMHRLRRFLKWFHRQAAIDENAERIARLRRKGARIGEGCVILSELQSTEPYLIEIGNRVAIAGGVTCITHNFLAFQLRQTHPNAQIFAPIRIGSGTMIGWNAVILPGTVIGAGCVINAGAVVRGTVPDNSVADGNPARVIGRASLLLKRLAEHPGRLDVFDLPQNERRERIERHFGLRPAD